MTRINESECEAAGLCPKEVNRIASGLSRYAKQAEKMGLCIFGGAGAGSIRFNDRGPGSLVVAELDGDFDGGDGGTEEDENGLLRGEC